ncbi:hypothetical protein M0804_003516 [Polistes exclamans]|nr:hypothetical protein M0804_003516 [Polistes exclamans]
MEMCLVSKPKMLPRIRVVRKCANIVLAKSLVSSLKSQESSSIVFNWTFEQDCPWQLVHAEVHCNPIFLQPHLAVQPFLQLQKIVLRSFSGAGGSKVLIASRVLSINFQPQSSGFS